jgi:hypothetical protein
MLPLQFCSYLSKYLILHMLNYYPIQRDHQIFRGAGTGLTAKKWPLRSHFWGPMTEQ